MRPTDDGIVVGGGVELLAANSHLSTPPQWHFASSPPNRGSNMIDTSAGVLNNPRGLPVLNWQAVAPNHLFRKLHVWTRALWAQWYINVVPLLGSPACRGNRKRWFGVKEAGRRHQLKPHRHEERDKYCRGRRVDSCEGGGEKGPCKTIVTTCYLTHVKPASGSAISQILLVTVFRSSVDASKSGQLTGRVNACATAPYVICVHDEEVE